MVTKKKVITVGYLPESDSYVLLKTGRRTVSFILYSHFSEIIDIFPLKLYDIRVIECGYSLTTIILNAGSKPILKFIE